MEQDRLIKKKISKRQKEMLVDFISSKPELYSGKFTPSFTRARCQALWSELATILNSMPEGANKNWEAWRKTWIDLKKNKKAKLATIRGYSQRTGGGPPLPEETKEKTYEDKIFDLLSPVAVEGNKGVPEPLIIDEESLEGQSENAKLQISLDVEDVSVGPQPTSSHTNTPISRKISVVPQKKFKRVTKTARLQESIKNHSKLVSISQQGVDETQEYRAEQLKILRQHYENKERLQRQQNEMLQKICNHLGDLVFDSLN